MAIQPIQTRIGQVLGTAAHQILTARAHEGVELLVLGDDLGSFANLEQHLAQMIGNLRAAMARPSGDDPTASG